MRCRAPGCAATFAIFHGVPLLLPSLSPGPVADAEFVREMSRIAVPPAEDLAHAVMQDLLADGHHLPFATLHHFPQPAQLLRRLAAKLRPGGLICILCEPVGHVTHGAMPEAFKEELLSGICEQAFEPWEWRSLIAAAGLRLAHVVHDRGSLKAALGVAR